MPWKEVSVMSQRKEFVMLAQGEDSNIMSLCQRFGISRVSAYKWLSRYRELGEAGLTDRPRTPHHSPAHTKPALENAVLQVRDAHPAWGPRKIRRYLQRHGQEGLPAPSTIWAILRREGRISPAEAEKHRPFVRFERSAPNELWQMDFKGHFALTQGRCYPLTVLDDHSRYALGIEACANEQGPTVKAHLSLAFERYGLPEAMLMDNGNPWGCQGQANYSTFEVWLMRLGIKVYHGRAFHPQTQGKEERFHRTLMAEVVRGRSFSDLAQCQMAFDDWRPVYNLERPHEALGMEVPAERYRISPRPLPKSLLPIEYGPDDLVRRVQGDGTITLHSRPFRIGIAFKGLPVGLRATAQDGIWDVFFMTHHVTQLDLTSPDGAADV